MKRFEGGDTGGNAYNVFPPDTVLSISETATGSGSPRVTRGDPYPKVFGRGLGPDVVGIAKGSPKYL